MTEETDKTNEGDQTMLQTLQCYHKLASDQTKHPVLAKDTTMIQFLAYSLDSNDLEVVEAALKTLELLANNVKNRNDLLATFGVVEALKSTYERGIGENLQKLAKNVFDVLESPLQRPNDFNSERSEDVVHDNKRKSQVFAFHVFGLNDESRQNLERAIVKVKGVVSVVVYPDHQRCIVRAIDKVTAEQLAEAISEQAQLEAHLVVKNRHNQEVLKDILGRKKIHPFLSGRGDLSPIEESFIENVDVLDDEDKDLPPYLPEEDSPVKEKALHPFDRFRTSAAGWVKTATSLFQNSFYW